MNPIIALWCHPRSMSTAVERVMYERGDLDCAHEPFMYDYYVHREVRTMPHFDVEPDRPQAYADIRGMLLARGEAAPVFFKDMSYYVYPQMRDDVAFAERLTHVFLVRNPMASIVSYHKLDPDLTLEEIGLEAQWRHYEWLCTLPGVRPAIVEAEAIQEDTEGIMSRLWSEIGLDYTDSAFDWRGSEQPEDWKQVDAWHTDATQSKGIRSIDREQAAAKAEAKFEKLVSSEPHLRELLDHHWPFYEKLRRRALTAEGRSAEG